MALAAARVERTRPARDVDDLGLVLRARAGDKHALDQMIRRYAGFVRLKASSYFIAGGDSDDLIQ
jgi:RNA polymerase sporulation-specific sigma factor